jgi:DNA-binding transcriptional LysR family regulator
MLDDLKRMVIFTHVVEAGSFSGAAKRLGIAKSAISKHVSLLENSIGAHLLNRTTRSLSLTDVGEAYYQSCSQLNNILEETRNTTEALQDEPRGMLKISTPASFGIDYIAPLLYRFLKQYPDLNAELLLDDNVVDMTEQGIDVAIRVGWLPDSNLRARKIKDSPRLLCASPEYIERKGLPEKPEDLIQHDWVIFTLLPTPHHYSFTKNNKSKNIQVKGRIKTNNGNAVRRLLLEGAGVSALADFLVNKDLKEGRLVRLLPEYDIADAGIYAVFQNQRLQQAKIRTFIDFLAENL